MDFINFINRITPHIDSYLAESVIAGYKTIFEYQTDMFLSDDEAKAKDERDELNHRYETEFPATETDDDEDDDETQEPKQDHRSIDREVIKALLDIKHTRDEGDLVFFHSSDANNMLNGSIEPQCGPWVQEVISGSTDDDDFIEELIEESRFVFLSDEPTWVEMKADRAGGIEHAHLAVILLNRYHWADSIYQLDENSERWIDLNGDSAGYAKGVGPEPGDFFTRDEVPVAYEFTGGKLKQFLTAYTSGKYSIK